jgi:glycosyltransferase involved in cell wall biosynthesis
MKIAIDARWIPREASGIGVYTRELVTRLPALAAADRFVLYFRDPKVRDDVMAAIPGAAGRVEAVTVPWGVHSIPGQWGLARDLRRRAIGLYHSPCYMFPFPAFPVRGPRTARLVVTIHDVVPLSHPDAVRGSKKRHLLPIFRRIHREAARRADRVLCVSDTARREILELLEVPHERHGRFCTVPNGVSSRLLEAGAARDGTPAGATPVVLYVGRADPYKNLAGLVAAFARVHERLKGGVRLRIVGSPDARYPEPMRIARELRIEESIEWSGYLSDAGLMDAYRSATVLAHPSRHEGFGLPVLEAMACGLPVVSSNRSALPEVTGGAAVLVDPDDAGALAGAILSVLQDPALAADLSRRGRARAAAFTWDRAARGVLAVYRSASGDGEPGATGALRE